jgi:hypothetical protein
MVRRVLFTAVGVVATLALFMGPAAATSEPVTKIEFKLDASSVPAGSKIKGLVQVTTGSGKAEVPFAGASLTVSIDGVDVGSTQADGAGVAVVAYEVSAPGQHTIRVTFVGDDQHKKAHKEREFEVTRSLGSPPPDPTTTSPPPPDPTTTTAPPPPDPTTTTPPPPDPTTTTAPPPPGPAPDAPEIYLFGTPTQGMNYLEWTVPPDNGSPIIRFNVYRSLSPGEETFLRSRGPDFNFVDDLDVTPGLTYFYVVTAENANGESLRSNEVSVTAS